MVENLGTAHLVTLECTDRLLRAAPRPGRALLHRDGTPVGGA
ncbi:hypothetical protein [Microbispora bryophytorum]